LAEPIRFAQTVLPAHEILTIVRSAGFNPIGRPGRDGANYVIRAIDRHGDDVQVIVGAKDANILFVRRLGSRVGMAAPTDFAGPRAYPPRYPDYFFGNVPRPPRTVPAQRAATPAKRTAAGPPVPRARPADVTGTVKTEPTLSAAPAGQPATLPAKPDVPPVVGFE
jgi:hypothetical protein